MENTNLVLNPDNPEGTWSSMFFIDDQRQKELKKLINLAAAHVQNDDPMIAFDSIRNGCTHINEYSYCVLMLGMELKGGGGGIGGIIAQIIKSKMDSGG